MKTLLSLLSAVARRTFFPLLFIVLKRKWIYLPLFFLVIAVSGCYQSFYRTNTKPSIDEATVQQLKSGNKYCIVHFPDSTFGLEQVFLSGDSLYGKIVVLPVAHSKYLNPRANDDENRVKAADKSTALIEIHLYTGKELKNNDSLFSASLTSFYRADVYEFNKPATTTNHIMSTVGLGLVAFITALVILLYAAGYR